MTYGVFTTKGTFYKTRNGKERLKYILRDRLDKSRIPAPNIQIWKYDRTLDKDELYNLYDFNLKNRQEGNSDVFFEYTVTGHNPNTTKAIAEYLYGMFKDRPIFVVEHYDESHYNTHFIVFNKDQKHSTGLNLEEKDLEQLEADVRKITRQKAEEQKIEWQIEFRPIPDEDGCVKSLFLNDVPEEQLDNLPNDTIVVEPDFGKYQAYIPLSVPFPKDLADDLQWVFALYFGSDPKEMDSLCLRPLTGFRDKKSRQPVAKIYKIVQNDMSTDQLIEKIKTNIETNTERKRQLLETLQQDSPELAQQIEQIDGTFYSNDIRGMVEEIFDILSGDKSLKNLQYASYLLRNGYDPRVVEYALYDNNQELVVKDPNEVQSRIQRLIDMASSSISTE